MGHQPAGPSDLRLIEDYLPIVAISKEASREKSVRKGHISTLHLWWARRPLVACRAAVYGALVPADRWFNGELPVHNVQHADDPQKLENWKNGTKRGLNRRAAGKFVTELCKYPGDPRIIAKAQEHILDAHAQRLTAELATGKASGKMPAWVEEFKFKGDTVTRPDIVAARAPRPRVLDMFAGGGAIPLEALRLGCEAYALDLNPVAHIIELCTLVYPQKYGKPDPAVRGMTGPKNAKGETTWGGLANEVRYWGNWVLEKVRKEIGDLYPLIPDPEYKKRKLIDEDRTDHQKGASGKQRELTHKTSEEDEPAGKVDVPPGFLMPVAYLWTRTVRCKNPACGATVPLVKQTWLCKKEDHYVALQMIAPKGKKEVRFEVVESKTEKGLGFDPAAFSEGGNATCPFCGTVADADYVQDQGKAKRTDTQSMAVVCTRPKTTGKVYLAADDLPETLRATDACMEVRIDSFCHHTGISRPGEPLNPLRPSPNARGLSPVTRHGMTTFADLFARRQLLCLLNFAGAVQKAHVEMTSVGQDAPRAKAIASYMGILVDRQADYNSSLARWHTTGEKMANTFGRHALAMVWDFAELAPFGAASGGIAGALEWVGNFIEAESGQRIAGFPARGSATALPYPDGTLDVVVTDPPYYDNVPYADISDFFYVWLKRSIGPLFPEHFSTELTPKKSEATALASRHNGDMKKATGEYERMMLDSFKEAARVLKPGSPLAVVYAHKTTLGWSTLVDALRVAGFTVTEAWPLDTEMKARMIAADAAALASSIFLIARKRIANPGVGNYEDDVQPELQQIVRERVATLWDMGIAGADLVIAAVGAGLRAFTKYEKVEYANGEEVPAQKFLAEVEGVVLDTMMGKLSGVVGGNVSAVDNASRFYVLWRFVYKTAELDAGEAIIFANGTHIELDSAHGVAAGKDALVEKKKAKYRLRDFTERGDATRLGLPSENGQPAPLIDALHRVLWLMDNSPRKLNEFLDEARPDRERLRVLAQALAGAALSGKSEEEAAKLVSTTTAEQAALGKLLANWRTLVESRLAAEDGTLFEKKK